MKQCMQCTRPSCQPSIRWCMQATLTFHRSLFPGLFNLCMCRSNFLCSSLSLEVNYWVLLLRQKSYLMAGRISNKGTSEAQQKSHLCTMSTSC